MLMDSQVKFNSPQNISGASVTFLLCFVDYETSPVQLLNLTLSTNAVTDSVFCPLLQTNLVASGGNESEIYIWDMNNFGSPMAPGPKTQVHLFYSILHYIVC